MLLIVDVYLSLHAHVYKVQGLLNIGHFLNFLVFMLLFINFGSIIVIQSRTFLTKLKIYWAKA